MNQGFTIVFSNSAGATGTVRFGSENELVEFMVATWNTEAPMSFKYADGSPVDVETIERIHARFFAATKRG